MESQMTNESNEIVNDLDIRYTISTKNDSNLELLFEVNFVTNMVLKQQNIISIWTYFFSMPLFKGPNSLDCPDPIFDTQHLKSKFSVVRYLLTLIPS